MTESEFNAALPMAEHLSEAAKDIAREVLVHGLSQTDAARLFATSRQNVHNMVRRFQAAAARVPSSWRRVEIWLPPREADRVEELAERLKKTLKRPGGQVNLQKADAR